ncbi:MAG: cation:proton antiporter subunit C [bacterium]|nr:cation:proton antiporter subunit C [bacterium]
MTDFFLYVTAVLLIFFGLTAVLYKRNLIKIVIALNILESGINLFFIALAYRPKGTAPIFTLAPSLDSLRMVLPTPQALILTNIVIGFATSALMLTLAVLTYRNNKTLDIQKLQGIENHD